jgi:hypothetical protein
MVEKVIVTTPEREATGQIVLWIVLLLGAALLAALYFPARFLWSLGRRALGRPGSYRNAVYYGVSTVMIWACAGGLMAIDITPYLGTELQKDQTPTLIAYMGGSLLGIVLAQAVYFIVKQRHPAAMRRG